MKVMIGHEYTIKEGILAGTKGILVFADSLTELVFIKIDKYCCIETALSNLEIDKGKDGK